MHALFHLLQAASQEICSGGRGSVVIFRGSLPQCMMVPEQCAACARTILGLMRALHTDMSKQSTQNLGVGDLEIEFYELEKYLFFNLDWDWVFPGVGNSRSELLYTVG